ncbi:MAG: hypothetical protein GAK30_03455 [Paracidovorax wautersii]|uniref:Methyl-accepting chemotaxis protein n=1 Tax=Paracidovorax wautersii TaxID=1177982 RepID=A0A7V8FL48_9BURK|nr:MAG: hypothetical protein GAK30_03455 [Paracidovorax wautersii]
MALPWLTALKVIPWKDVIAATPQVVKGAQKLYESVKTRPRPAEAPVSGDDIERLRHDPQALLDHVQQLNGRLARLDQQQRETAELLRALAEQNEKLAGAVETLRVRTRLLLRVSVVLVAAVVVLAIVAARLG